MTVRQQIEHDAHFNALLKEAGRQYAIELFEASAWRASFLMLVSAVLVLVLARLADVQHDTGLGLAWLSIAVCNLLLLIMFARARSAQQILLVTFLSVCSLAAWWIVLASYIPLPEILIEALFVLLIVAVGNISWPFRYTLALSNILIFCSLWYASGERSEAHSQMLGVVVMVVILASRSSALANLELTARLSSRIAALACQWQLEGLTLLKLTAVQIGLLSDGETALLAVDGQGTLLIRKGQVYPSPVDEVFVRGMRQQVDSAGGPEGVLSTRVLGQQFLPAFFDWFKSIPAGVLYHRFSAVIDDQEREACIFAPYSLPLRLAGRRRVIRAASWMSRVVRLALLTQRSRFVSSGMISASQSSAEEQEQELNRMVHRVNNSTQEMAVIADRLGRLIQSLPLAVTDRLSMEAELTRLEDVSRTLSAEISDVKLLKEMQEIEISARSESIRVGTVLQGLEQYARQRAYRRGWEFSIQAGEFGDKHITVLNREFLETVLRCLLRAAGSHCGGGNSVCLRIETHGNSLRFIFEDNGQLVPAEECRALERTDIERGENPWGIENAAAVMRFVLESKGELGCGAAQGPYCNRIYLSLPLLDKVTKVSSVNTGWALLVDDNPETVTFYSRIAQALGLRSVMAGSLAEAGRLAQADSQPRLVITDVQLGDGSGLDLVKMLRSRFGAALPVIVVSGETDAALRDKISQAGATRYLTKPVGRKRLFAEIKEILHV